MTRSLIIWQVTVTVGTLEKAELCSEMSLKGLMQLTWKVENRTVAAAMERIRRREMWQTSKTRLDHKAGGIRGERGMNPM